ncbi:MAG: hypothetical protein ACXAEU_15020 [Candidatus Hodarchaeales archaeon]|jgi:hypothetical protein
MFKARRNEKVPGFIRYNKTGEVKERKNELEKRLRSIEKKMRIEGLDSLNKYEILERRNCIVETYESSKYLARYEEVFRFAVSLSGDLINENFRIKKDGDSYGKKKKITNLWQVLPLVKREEVLKAIITENYARVLLSSVPSLEMIEAYKSLEFEKDMSSGRKIDAWRLTDHLAGSPERVHDLNKVAAELNVSEITVRRKVAMLKKWKLVSFSKGIISETDAMHGVLKDRRRGSKGFKT